MYGTTKDPEKSSNVKKKKNKAGGILLSDFKLYCKAIVTMVLWYWHKIRTQVNGTEYSPEINPCIYSQFMTKEFKKIQWRKGSLFNK